MFGVMQQLKADISTCPHDVIVCSAGHGNDRLVHLPIAQCHHEKAPAGQAWVGPEWQKVCIKAYVLCYSTMSAPKKPRFTPRWCIPSTSNQICPATLDAKFADLAASVVGTMHSTHAVTYIEYTVASLTRLVQPTCARDGNRPTTVLFTASGGTCVIYEVAAKRTRMQKIAEPFGAHSGGACLR